MSVHTVKTRNKQALGQQAGIASENAQKNGHTVTKAVISRRGAFYDFITLTEFFPDKVFNLCVWDGDVISVKENHDLRRRHDRMRPGFLKLAATAFHPELEIMGLPPEEIEEMRHSGQRPRNRRQGGWEYDLTIDHKRELCRGGELHVSNIAIVPHFLNVARNRLLQVQMKDRKMFKDIVTLEYKEGNKTLVPYVEGGFQRFDSSRDAVNARFAPLFRGRTLERF